MLANIKIQGKILIIIGILALATAITAYVGYTGLQSLTADAVSIHRTSENVKRGARINQDLLWMNRAEYRVAMDPGEVGDASRVLLEHAAHFDEMATEMERTLPAERRAALAEIRRLYSNYLASAKTTLERAQKHKDVGVDAARAEIETQVRDSRTIVNEMNEKVKAFVDGLDTESLATATNAADEASHLNLLMIGISVAGIVAGVVLGVLIARIGVVFPLVRITGSLGQLSQGKLDEPILGADRLDEVGDLARAAVMFRDQGREAARLRAEQEELKARAARDQRAAMLKMADNFESKVGDLVRGVASAATEMQATAHSMSATAEETNAQAGAVAAASEETSVNVQTVATATEELTSSVEEIGRQVTQSARIASRAVDDAKRTDQTVQALAADASRIGTVVTLIQDIAGQTNLLALNATIEAARAGEAGRGFAVVASEVKSLATQTARATTEIAGQISAIQGATTETVSAIREIIATIGQINDIATVIAAAVEEQGAATKEIARNVQEASRGTQEVSSNIFGVREAATATGQASNQVLSAAGELAQQADGLSREVGQFIASVRAG
jgi:methyl-accepting chemotaxis protein